MTITGKESLQEWNYFLESEQLEYNEYVEDKNINSFYYNKENIICNIEKCYDENEKVNYFFKVLKNIKTD